MQQQTELANKNIDDVILNATINNVKILIEKHIPQSTQFNFLISTLNDVHLSQDFLQILGITNTSKLEAFLIKDFVLELDLPQYADYLSLLNAYFVFENISDNLALDLGRGTKTAIGQSKYKILHKFNLAIISKLELKSAEKQIFLNACSEEIKKISICQLSLSPKSLRMFYDTFTKKNNLENNPEYNIEDYLTLNIEACLDLLKSIKTHFLHDFIKSELIKRYQGVNELLENSDKELSKLLALRKSTILVAPTLAYAIAALDISSPIPNFITIQDLFQEACNTAATLVGLLNDVGTHFLTMQMENLIDLKKELMSPLLQFPEVFNGYSLTHYLRYLFNQEKYSTLFNRLKKDTLLGEFNICLDGLRDVNITESFDKFFANLLFCVQEFQQYEALLTEQLKTINMVLNDTRICKIISQFVAFHKKMYLAPYDTNQGDYAILEQKDNWARSFLSRSSNHAAKRTYPAETKDTRYIQRRTV